MSLNDKRTVERSTDDDLGFGAPAKATDEPVQAEVGPEEDEASYLDSWYQVLKAQAAGDA